MSFKLRVTTTNIKHFPLMSHLHVYQDAVKVRENSGLALMQEIADPNYVAAVKSALGTAFDLVGEKQEVPVAYRKSRFKVVEVEVIPLTPSLGAGLKSPARYLTRVVLKANGLFNRWLPEIEVQNIHYVQAAFGRKPVPKRLERQRLWKEAWDKQQKLVIAARAAGRIVIFGGDWNRQGHDIPKFAPAQIWAIGGKGGLDHVGVLLPRGVALSVSKQINLDINSDHNLKGATFTFRKVRTK